MAGVTGFSITLALGLYDRPDSVALAPTHVWDIVPGDLVSSAILATAAAVSAGIANELNRGTATRGLGAEEPSRMRQTGSSTAGRPCHAFSRLQTPLIVHAATTTTYPVSMVEVQWVVHDFIKLNPAPFRLPGTLPFKLRLDHVPDEAAVERAKWWTGLKVGTRGGGLAGGSILKGCQMGAENLGMP